MGSDTSEEELVLDIREKVYEIIDISEKKLDDKHKYFVEEEGE